MYRILLDHIKETYPEITDQDFNGIIKLASFKEYTKKQIIWREGDFVNEANFVLKGCFRYYSTNQDGYERNTQFAIENWWIGDFISLLHDKPTQQSVQALEDCQVLFFIKSDFKYLMDNNKSFREFTSLKRDMAYEATMQRLTQINEPAEVRYENLMKKYPKVLNRIPLYHVASYLGITPESLSRLRKHHMINGVIKK